MFVCSPDFFLPSGGVSLDGGVGGLVWSMYLRLRERTIEVKGASGGLRPREAAAPAGTLGGEPSSKSLARVNAAVSSSSADLCLREKKPVFFVRRREGAVKPTRGDMRIALAFGAM